MIILQTGESLYSPYISTQVIAPLFRSHRYTVEWLETIGACQKDMSDVFCQSWSLYLQMEKVRKLMHGDDTVIQIPVSAKAKFTLLKSFFIEIMPVVCVDLTVDYRNNVAEDIMSYNPCDLIMNMTYNDFQKHIE